MPHTSANIKTFHAGKAILFILFTFLEIMEMSLYFEKQSDPFSVTPASISISSSPVLSAPISSELACDSEASSPAIYHFPLVWSACILVLK